MKLEASDLIAELEQYNRKGYECVLIGQIRIISNNTNMPSHNIDNNIIQTITELGLINKKKIQQTGS